MPEKTEPRRDERAARIVSVARVVFLRQGFAATSMSQIAAAAGGSKATLYHYFPSKKELFFAVVRAESARTLEHLFEGAAEGPDVAADLKVLCNRFLHLMLSEDLIALFRLITAEAGRFPEVGQLAYESGIARGLKRMADILAAAMARGDLKAADPYQMAEMLFNLAMGNLHLRRLWQVDAEASEAEIAARSDQLTERFLSLCAASVQA